MNTTVSDLLGVGRPVRETLPGHSTWGRHRVPVPVPPPGPQGPPEPPQAPAGATAPAIAPGTPAARVLLVDDTPDVRLMLRLALSRHPEFTVVGEAENGQVAVKVATDTQPDLVLLDLAMPVMSGMEALPLIRRAAPGAKIVAFSGFEGDRMAENARLAGADRYVHKGATATQIVNEISSALGITPTPTRRLSISGEADESELERIQAAMATAAHELRGPAAVMSVLAEELRDQGSLLDTSTVNDILDAIVRQSRVLDRVTADLLTSTQSHRGVLTMQIQPTELHAVLDAAAVSSDNRSRVQVCCDDELWVNGDRIRIQQMIGNLLSNAVKYGAPPLAITARRDGDQAQVCVTDHGAGVAESFRDSLFTRFARAQRQHADGTGLGLSVVKVLAEAQGGRAWYEPSSDGSAFCFSVPLCPEAEVPERSDEHPGR